MAVFTKAIGAARSAADAAARPDPAERPAPAPPNAGFDEIRIPLADGRTRHLTRAEYEALLLPERVGLLMSGKMQFFRQGRPVSAREALRSR
jgi:hypothetical protein